MKRGLPLLCLLLALLLSACGVRGEDHSHDLPWRTALMDPTLPDGNAVPDAVSYCFTDDDGAVHVENVTFPEINAYLERRTHLPRTAHFDAFLSEGVRSLLPVLDYALCRGCTSLCVPTTALEGSELFAASRWLELIYHANSYGVTGRTVSSFENRAGETVRYIYVAFQGMQDAVFASRFRAGLEEAERIVASVPEGADEVAAARYLYQYLTDHVAYDDEYRDHWDMRESCLLYDALSAHATVCAGFETALYTLYNLAGIECFSVFGELYGPAIGREDLMNGNGHAWSIARLNGEYYEFDPTWDVGEPPENYRFFAVSTEDIQAYYPRVYDAITEEYAPPCTKTLVP